MDNNLNALLPRVVITGLLFIVVFISGFWLANSARPINALVLTIHKLIALGALILIGVTIYQVNQVAPLSSTAIVATVTTGILFVITIIVGGLLSLDQPVTAVSIVHKIGPFVTVGSVIVTMYLLAHPQQ